MNSFNLLAFVIFLIFKRVCRNCAIDGIDGIDDIPISAFNGWPSLISAEISVTVTSIGGYAFNSCSALETVTIGEGVETIGNSALVNFEILKFRIFG